MRYLLRGDNKRGFEHGVLAGGKQHLDNGFGGCVRKDALVGKEDELLGVVNKVKCRLFCLHSCKNYVAR